MFDIREDDLTGPATQALVALHLAGMHANSPPGSVFALDIAALRTPDVTFWTAWRADKIAGMGALKMLGGRAGEVKSMRTHPDFLRQGVAARLLDHIIAAAKARGLHSLSLETGSSPAFEPALSLYRRRGFRDGDSFADYPENPFSRFLHLPL